MVENQGRAREPSSQYEVLGSFMGIGTNPSNITILLLSECSSLTSESVLPASRSARTSTPHSQLRQVSFALPVALSATIRPLGPHLVNNYSTLHLHPHSEVPPGQGQLTKRFPTGLHSQRRPTLCCRGHCHLNLVGQASPCCASRGRVECSHIHGTAPEGTWGSSTISLGDKSSRPPWNQISMLNPEYIGLFSYVFPASTGDNRILRWKVDVHAALQGLKPLEALADVFLSRFF